MPAVLSVLVLTSSTLYHLLDPVPKHGIHHHIEDCGGQRVPLCQPPETLKFHPVVSFRSLDHPQTISVRPEEAASSRPLAVSLQDFQACVPFLGVIRREKVQKYHVQDLLPHGR